LQFHYKTWIPLFGATLTISGWWAWNLFLSAIYSNNPGPYTVYHAFTEEFGRNPTWWAVLVAVLAVVILLEVVVEAARRRWWPSLVDIWQELEKVEGVKRRLVESGGEGGYGVRIDG
jgi:phospholipid-translocating ATPase